MSRQTCWSACFGFSWLFVASVWAQTPATPLPVAQSAAPLMTPLAQAPGQLVNPPSGQANIISLPELQALVAPVALYPDGLLAQMLMAATYPLEVASATIWLQNNRLTGSAFEAALSQQRWDNSVKSLVHFPEALKLLGNQLEWTHRLGDAYLVQPSELMQAVQALRSHARQTGNLQSGTQMVVSTDPLSNIIIMPTNPDIVYVPTYNPMVVYGPWPYPAYQPYAVYNPGWGRWPLALVSAQESPCGLRLIGAMAPFILITAITTASIPCITRRAIVILRAWVVRATGPTTERTATTFPIAIPTTA